MAMLKHSNYATSSSNTMHAYEGFYLLMVLGNNGYYLRTWAIEEHPYLEFASSDIGDLTMGNEIWVDSDDSTINNSDTLFWPVRVDKNVVTLRNFGNNNFCNRLSTEGKTSCLNVGVSTISREARLEVRELVLSRNIYNVNFCLMDVRIYDQRVIVMTIGDAINMNQEPHTQQVKLSYTETKSCTWNGSVSSKLGIQITIESGVPFITDGKLEISSEFSGT
ncbi:cytolytic protein enterolobin-like [Vitis riparia]|uniref:cytolytic protein enterolobin-like n=1 Tax=Vitis riparia TaxID=96939 RepID=UPI00155A805F|nr:cytolytic protein enterolobin-like [Vitis riparia]